MKTVAGVLLAVGVIVFVVWLGMEESGCPQRSITVNGHIITLPKSKIGKTIIVKYESGVEEIYECIRSVKWTAGDYDAL